MQASSDDNSVARVASRATDRSRTIFYNIVVLFVIANLFYWAIPTIASMTSGVRDVIKSVRSSEDSRVRLPNYAGVPWASRHFKEYQALATDYKSFIGWRRKKFEGGTIVIEGPYLQRRTINNQISDKTVYFFGGSTMWGTGADNAGTIPSQFAAITGMRAENFGETAYVAHQSLVLLLQLIQEGHRPQLVIFYDGVNDVAHKCRRELTPESDGREFQIASALQAERSLPTSFTYFLRPIMHLANTLNKALFRSMQPPNYDCHSNPQKAAAITENMVRDWLMAKQLVEAYGGQFIGILQPVSYFSNTRLSHLRLSRELQAQYESVYPLMRDKLARAADFHDFTTILDADEHIYIDFCHLSPNGNRRVAAAVAELVLARAPKE